MYLEHFGLKESPFKLTPDARFIFLGRTHRLAKLMLDHVWSEDPFVIVTGEIGCGKTMLIENLLGGLDENVRVARLSQTQLNAKELLQALLTELGFRPFDEGKPQLLLRLSELIQAENQAGHKVLFVLDEAQNLSPDALEEIRLLADAAALKSKGFCVVLFGQPELRDRLANSQSNKQLAQRIRLSFHLKPLEQNEVPGYIEHRLRVAGANRKDIFDQASRDLIYEFTEGVPRLINVLCDTCLIIAFADELESVNSEVVWRTVEELQWTPAFAHYSVTSRSAIRRRSSDGPINQTPDASERRQQDRRSGIDRRNHGKSASAAARRGRRSGIDRRAVSVTETAVHP